MNTKDIQNNSVDKLFFENIFSYKNEIAIITDCKNFSYSDIDMLSTKIATYLETRNLVFIICKNKHECIIGYLAILRKSCIPVLLNDDISSNYLYNLISKYRPKYFFIPQDIRISGSDIIYSYGDYNLLKTNAPYNYVINKALAQLITTSGSTGSPNFVRQSYMNIESNIKAITKYLEINHSDRAITTMPMNYTYGLSIINTHLFNGASIVLTDKTLLDKKFWALVKKNNVTTFGGVPYIYGILKRIDFLHMDLPSLKYITQAGGKLSCELALEFAEICAQKKIKFFTMYGQTEATARMSYLPADFAIKKAGSIGVAIPNGEFWLVDENNIRIEQAYVTGELVYSGENVSLGYARSYLDLSMGDENNGILYTGDLAQYDEDGFYFIIGRKKRFIKLYGHRLNMDEVELQLNDAGFDCVCNGADDELKIYTTNKEDIQSIKLYLIKNTNINKSGFNVYYTSQIPRNPAGKVLYTLLDLYI